MEKNDFQLIKDGNCIALELYLQDYKLQDLNVDLFGMQECSSDNHWGWGVRGQYLIHFVISGKGTFKNVLGNYTLEKGMGFIFSPGDKVTYSSDPDDPWVYIWLGFSGKSVPDFLHRCEFSTENPIFYFDESFDIVNYFAYAENLEHGREFYILSVLYHFFSIYAKPSSRAVSKVDLAKNYIIKNYANDITVQKVANYIFTERKYFCRIFKEKTGLSPQQYIQNIRLTHSHELLVFKNVSVSDVATSVGYKNVSSFSKAFKRKYGVSPTDMLNGAMHLDTKNKNK